jgi:hypothetical protein
MRAVPSDAARTTRIRIRTRRRIAERGPSRLFMVDGVRLNAMARLVHSRFPYYDFYKQPDVSNGEEDGLSFNQFLHEMDDSKMEHKHNYVQWVFPNPIPSRVQKRVARQPCTDEEYRRFMSDTIVMERVEAAITKMLRFWGITYDQRTGYIAIKQCNSDRFIEKLGVQNHNQLRFTRMLIFLQCIERHSLAHTLFGFFSARWIPIRINADSWNAWCDALGLEGEERKHPKAR